ncbi:hypothetical protein GE21DRAFT_1045251 [Neurospora crassa]|nr:hypothetical protein GE21DRAFT_1045251 [Neurospora crassa]
MQRKKQQILNTTVRGKEEGRTWRGRWKGEEEEAVAEEEEQEEKKGRGRGKGRTLLVSFFVSCRHSHTQLMVTHTLFHIYICCSMTFHCGVIPFLKDIKFYFPSTT